MSSLEEELFRAREAEALLANPLLVQALSEIKTELYANWLNSPVRDVEGRELIFLGLRVLQQLEGNLRAHITTGKMAKIQLGALAEEERHELH